MSITNTLWQFAEKIEKSNSAGIFFSLISGPDDDTFKEKPPIVQVYIFKSKHSDEEVASYLALEKEYGHYMSANIPDDQKIITFAMEGINEVNMWALIVPDQEWGDVYGAKWYPLSLRRGKVTNLIVSLEKK